MQNKLSLNTRITKYFLEHSRITLLALISLVLFGLVSVLTLRTTGFPSPTINVVVINTFYPGGSANSVVDQVSKPIENVIKSIDGVKSYSSTSQNSFSNVVVTIDEKANADAVKAKLDAAVRSVTLPDGAEKPELITPKITSDEYFYTLVRNEGNDNLSDTYKVLDTLRVEVEKDTDVNAFTIQGNIEQKVLINIDNNKLTQAGFVYSDIINSLRTWGLSLPVARDANLDSKRYSINLSISGKSIEDLKNIPLISITDPTKLYKISDFAEVKEDLVKNEGVDAIVGYRNDNQTKISKSTIFSIDTVDKINLSSYDQRLKNILDKYFNKDSEEFKKLSQTDRNLFSKYKLISILNTQEDNEKQVKEVVAGLIGEKWHTGNGLGYLGWIFGGIQLVFLVMLALVSWRAALIAAIALPLSFFFSTIYVKFTGNDLNTLVLFSLVLVIGLVVDPALVILESIQRNLDNGLDRKTAVLNAVQEIGNGLLLAVVTSMLVFIPFGVVSGIFGEIISYIPLTIIPAIIGSYLVPLVFLTWIASKFLKRGKKSSDEEHENLWPIARWLVRVNESILKPGIGHVLLRIFILAISILIPFGVAGFYFGSGKVKSVQFAQPEDGDLITITTQNYPQKTYSALENDSKTLVSEIIKNDKVDFVTPFSGFDGSNGNTNITYLVNLKDRSERKGIKAVDIAKDLNQILKDKFESTYFFAEAGVLGNGPGSTAFPMSIAVKTNDLEDQKKVALDITKILNTVCKTGDRQFEIKSNCNTSEKVVSKIDNGYEGKEIKFIEILLQRDKLNRNPVNPIELKTLLSSLFEVNDGSKVATLNKDGKDYEVVLEKIAADPNKLDQIKNLEVRTLIGSTVKLSEIADIKEVQSVESIRRLKGETVGVVNAKTTDEFNNQAIIAQIQNKVIEEFNNNYKSGYKDVVVETYSEGDTAGIAKSFGELGVAFLLAIILTYVVLVIFFNSFTQPLVILFSIPLTFIGIFPALAAFAGGQMGFLEIIGIIILVGLVENVAIFLIDGANQKIKEGWDDRKAIAYASGVRFRPIILTKLTTLVSTAPLAILSEQYRSISVVIIFGLLTSGIVSLFTSPILFIFFKWLSKTVRRYPWWGKLLFFISIPVLPLSLAVMYGISDKK